MGQYSSYYLYQKYEKRGDQPFVPVYPAVYSVDGDGTREPVVKNENDYQCGWTGETGTLYRWVDLPIDTDYVCDECPDPIYRWVETSGYMCNGVTKFNREIKQVSYDEGISWHDTADYRAGSTIIEQKSADCGYAERWVETGEYRCEYSADTQDAQYRWVNIPIETDYECVDTSKYYKQKYQVSTDSGETWSDVVPAQYRVGDLYEASSLDCGAEATYRWYRLPINEGYVCSGTSKYYKEVYQVSTDSGSTWRDVTPAQYRMGDLYETDSVDCENEGYAAIVNHGERKVECTSALTWSMLTGHADGWSGYSNGITSVVIGRCVTHLADCCGTYPGGIGTFDGMRFSTIDIPSSVVEIGYSCFHSCYNLQRISIPDSVRTIGKYGFYYCTSLTSVTFGTGVTEVGTECFNYCSSLTTLTFKSPTPPTFGYSVFRDTNLQHVYVPAESVSAYQEIFGNIVSPII